MWWHIEMFLTPGNIPDVHIGEHDQEVAEPAGHGARQQQDRHEVSQES